MGIFTINIKGLPGPTYGAGGKSINLSNRCNGIVNETAKIIYDNLVGGNIPYISVGSNYNGSPKKSITILSIDYEQVEYEQSNPTVQFQLPITNGNFGDIIKDDTDNPIILPVTIDIENNNNIGIDNIISGFNIEIQKQVDCPTTASRIVKSSRKIKFYITDVNGEKGPIHPNNPYLVYTTIPNQ